MAFVFLFIRGSIVSAVRLPEFISTSAKIGFAFSKHRLEEVAIKVLGVVITSSFSPIFNER